MQYALPEPAFPLALPQGQRVEARAFTFGAADTASASGPAAEPAFPLSVPQGQGVEAPASRVDTLSHSLMQVAAEIAAVQQAFPGSVRVRSTHAFRRVQSDKHKHCTG